MAQHISYQRWSYNQHLAARNEAKAGLKEGERRPSVAALSKQIRKARPEWAKAHSGTRLTTAGATWRRH